jgi:uncharacterized protein
MRVRGKGRGFASMSQHDRRKIAAMGGREAHRLGHAHKWSREEAQEAGRKGGTISRRGPAGPARKGKGQA